MTPPLTSYKPLFRFLCTESHVMTLQRYIPIPFFSPGLGRFIQINSEQTYLAQSRDGTLMKMMDTKDLNACLNIGHAYFCEEHAMMKVNAPNCLLQLFRGIGRHDLALCNVHVLPEVFEIYEKTRTEYIITSSAPTSILQTCEDSSTTAATSTSTKLDIGTYKLAVNPNCTTSSDHWVIDRSTENEDADINCKEVKFDFDLQTLHQQFNQQDFSIIQSMIDGIGKPMPLTEFTQMLKFRKDVAKEESEYRMARAMTSFEIVLICVVSGTAIIIAAYIVIRMCKNCHQNPTHNYEAGQSRIVQAPDF